MARKPTKFHQVHNYMSLKKTLCNFFANSLFPIQNFGIVNVQQRKKRNFHPTFSQIKFSDSIF